MEIKNYTTISQVPQSDWSRCRTGRWGHWSRVFILTGNKRCCVVKANMLERFLAAILKILQIDYFNVKLRERVKVLHPSELNSPGRKIQPTAAQLLDIKPKPASEVTPPITFTQPQPNLPQPAKHSNLAKPSQIAVQQTPPQPKPVLALDLNPTSLTAEHISRMSPDQQGALIDHFAPRGSAGSRLSAAQLKGMLRSQNRGSIQIINKQELGLGHCGRYSINNALQKEFLSREEFLKLTGEVFVQRTGMPPENAKSLLADNDDFAVDVGILEHILDRRGIPVQHRMIRDLPGIGDSKQQALEQALGNAKWAIIGNTGSDRDRKPHVYDMPSSGNASYPLTSGHFAALHKDDRGQWWYIDSRGHAPENIALAVIPSTCTLIFPRNITN